MTATRTDWWRGATLYQIYPRSFADSNGDGVGDLAGITARLEYVAGLGVDGVWISPFFPSPMRDFGYDVTDHCGVDPIFGTLADFDVLLARAHALGLKVIIDQVWSHTAIEHPWFTESRQSHDNAKADWYVWADAKPDGSPPNNWLSWMGGPAWTWEPRRKQYYFHNFLPQMPDLNFHCMAVQDAILDAARFWLARGLDGFRMDTANLYFHSRGLEDNPTSGIGADMPVLMQRHAFNTDQPETLPFLERLRALMNQFDAPMAVAEIGGGEPMVTMVDYTAGSERLHTAYSFAMLGARPDAAAVAAQMLPWQQGRAATAWPSWAFSNHDAVRVATRWGGAGGGGFAFGGGDPVDGANASATTTPSPAFFMALLMALRGTLFLYQGEELGLPQAEVPFEFIQDPFGKANWPTNKGRDGCRTPMPWQARAPAAGFSSGAAWLPVPDEHRALAVDVQEANPQSTLQLTRALIALRHSHPALRLGHLDTLHAEGALLVLQRQQGDDVVLAAFNLGPAALNFTLPAPPRRSDGALAVAGARLDADTLHLPPWSALLQPLCAPIGAAT